MKDMYLEVSGALSAEAIDLWEKGNVTASIAKKNEAELYMWLINNGYVEIIFKNLWENARESYMRYLSTLNNYLFGGYVNYAGNSPLIGGDLVFPTILKRAFPFTAPVKPGGECRCCEESRLEPPYPVLTMPIPNPPMREIEILKIAGKFDQGKTTGSPLILDLNNDGIRTTILNHHSFFDHDGNGFAERTGWVDANDALLVRDLNGNGQIDDGGELFGNNTLLSNGQKAANGFEALRDLDSNGDGVINSLDEAWNQLRLWQDRNGNGRVDEGELLTLDEAGIAGLNLRYSNSGYIDENGNEHRQTGSFIRTDGTTGDMSDVWFQTDPVYRKELDLVEVPDAIKALPDLEGYGILRSLHQAMARDPGGLLQTLVEQFVAETDPMERKIITEKIIFAWAGVTDFNVMRGGTIKEGKIAALELFLAENFRQGPYSAPGPAAASVLEEAFNILASNVSALLSFQSHYREQHQIAMFAVLLAGIMGESIDVSALVTSLELMYDSDPGNAAKVVEFIHQLASVSEVGPRVVDALRVMGDPPRFTMQAGSLFEVFVVAGMSDIPFVFGTSGNDYVVGGPGEGFYIGGAGNDTLKGGNGNDILFGGAGDDSLIGCDGDDILWGGAGNDRLEGGMGDDTYLWGRGDGNDVINDYDLNRPAKRNVIHLGPGISADDIEFLLGGLSSSGADFVIRLKDTGETLTVQYGLSAVLTNTSHSYSIQAIKFVDGTVWEWSDILKQPMRVLDGVKTAGADSAGSFLQANDLGNTLTGSGKDDILYGGTGDDRLLGGAGNDILWGGAGNDRLDGGAGDDTYLWGRGDGNDVINDYDPNRPAKRNVIRLGTGIGADDIEFLLGGVNGSGIDFVIRLKDTGETLTVQYGLSAVLTNTSHSYSIQAVEFADGTVWEWSDILKQPMRVLDGVKATSADSAGSFLRANDLGNTLTGSGKDDILHGGTGDDRLVGGAGNDTLWGGAGNDRLEGGTGDDTYLWGRGDGNDVINDYDPNRPAKRNVIRLGAGIGADDIEFLLGGVNSSGIDFVIRLKDTGETLTVQYGLSTILTNTSHSYSIQAIEFADGTVWEWSDILTQPMRVLDGVKAASADSGGSFLQANDLGNTLSGSAKDDILYGGAGNDTLTGGAGNDTLWGGAGNDRLEGGAGDDTYLWGRGDGNDVINDYDPNRPAKRNVIRLGAGIGADDIEFLLGGVNSFGIDFVIRLKDTGETLTVQYGLSTILTNTSHSYSIQVIEFADGTVWEWSDILKQPMRLLDGVKAASADSGGSFLQANDLGNTLTGSGKDDILYGGAGNDTLTGGAGNDILWGGAGNDRLDGGAGDDTYLFGRGDGADTIYDTGGNDKLIFGEGISISDLWFAKSGSDLVVNVLGAEDQVKIQSWYSGANYKVETMTVGDLNLASTQMDQLIQALASFGAPQGVDGGWTEEQKEALAPILSTYWKPATA